MTKRIAGAITALLVLVPAPLMAEAVERAQDAARDTGISAIWLLANVSFAGMRAQGHPSVAWRFISFFFGFPGTLLSVIAVREGGERAYGIDLPRSAPESTEVADLRFVRRDQ